MDFRADYNVALGGRFYIGGTRVIDMTLEMAPPREAVVDLALLLEQYLQKVGDVPRTDDQVMDLHLMKKELKEREEAMDQALERIHLQGVYLSMTRPQKAALRESAVALVGTCMHILDITGLLDPEKEV
jgi:hypothetical protein